MFICMRRKVVDGSLGVPVTPRLVQNQQQAVAAPLLLAISVHNTISNTNNINNTITTKTNDQLYPLTKSPLTTNKSNNTKSANDTTCNQHQQQQDVSNTNKASKNHNYPHYFCPNQQKRKELIKQWLRVATNVDLGRPSSLCSPFTASHS